MKIFIALVMSSSGTATNLTTAMNKTTVAENNLLEVEPLLNKEPDNTLPAHNERLFHLFTDYIKSPHFRDVLISLSEKGLILEMNSTGEHLFGVSSHELKGMHYRELLLPDDAEKLADLLHLLRTDPSVKSFTHQVQKKDGGTAYITWSSFWSQKEQLLLLVGKDVTDITKVQQEQLAKEQIFQALIDNSFDLLALVDEYGHYTYVSESFSNTFEYNARVLMGYKASELIGVNCFTLMHPEDLPRLLEQYELLFTTEKKIQVLPFRFKTATGQWRWTEAIVTNQLDHPDIKAIVVSARDIHQQVNAENRVKEMQLLEALMEGEEKERSRIARDLHDEVSGMISAARMLFGTLREKAPLATDIKEFRQGMELLEEVALQVRRTSHKLMPEVVLENGLDEALCRYCTTISNDKLQVDYFSFGDMGRLSANFELSLYRIAQELINNIVKHAFARQAIVQLSCQSNMLSLTIEDDGKGFIPAHQNKGTGLASIQKRIEAMGGQLELKSEVGKGTSIYMEFENYKTFIPQ